MKKILLLFVMVLGVIPTMWADISVQTKIFDANSQPMLVGGFIDNYSKQNVSKKGIIVSKNADDMIITDDTVFDRVEPLVRESLHKDIQFIDCTDISKEQFSCALLYLWGNTDYYVKAFVIDTDNNVYYGNTEKVHTQDYNRYNGRADYANVWHAFECSLFDLVTDEIINPNDGFYYSTNENPRTVRHQIGTGYNTCYKFATEWNYKLWYYHSGHSDTNKQINVPITSFSNGKLTIEKNPLDADKDISIYYSINGNYFRPETYTDVYTAPIEITEPCAVYCYAISSDGYISYTNIYVIGDYTIGNEDEDNSDFGKVADVVDLGLSVKWASWNVGASKVADYGGLYGVGDPTGLKTSTNYSDYYWKDGESICGTEYDLAHVKWGDKWRMPSWNELEELQTKCEWTSGEVNGIKGSWIKGPNGNSIFLPYAGYRKGESLVSERDVAGHYWSGDMGVRLHSCGYKDFDITTTGVYQTDGAENYVGQSIRPVYIEEVDEPQIDEAFGKVADVVDLGLSVKWASWNVGASKVADYGGLYGVGDPTGLKTSTNYSDYYWKDGESICGTEYDLAHVKWGDKWRMPSWNELEELQTKCEWTSGEVNGIKGSWIKGPNGNSIFLPYAGYRKGESLVSERDVAGHYWSGDMGVRLHSCGYKDFDITTTGVYQTDGAENYVGQSIRPVYVETLPTADDNGGIDFGDNEINEDTDLNGNVIGNIYYNISDENGEYSPTEGCITLRTPTTDEEMNELDGQDIFGENFKDNYTGIVFKIQAGSGTIKVSAESTGSMTLKVKIGNSAPITMELEGKMKASFPYSVTEPTYVYIYCGETSTTNARGLRAASSNNALKIYGIEWSEEASSIESIYGVSNADAVIYNLQGQRLQTVTKGINIVNGKKVIIK